MVSFSEAERELVVKALLGVAQTADREFDEHVCPEEFETDGVTCVCDWELPAVLTAGTCNGVVENLYVTPRGVVDAVLDAALELLNSRRTVGEGLDARGIPTAGCPNCGEQWMKVPIVFDDETYEISAWGLEGECVTCGTLVTVCTPVDKEFEDE